MIYAFRGFELDSDLFELRRGEPGVEPGEPGDRQDKIHLQPKVMSLLIALVRRRDRVALKHELLQEVWADVVVSEGSLLRAVHEARRAIGDDAQEVIATVRGRGFRFTAEVRESRARPLSTPASTTSAANVVTSSTSTTTSLTSGHHQPSQQLAEQQTLIGREPSLTLLLDRLQAATLGRSGLAVVTGERGIGKSRVIDELAARARARSVKVLSGRAPDVDGAPPLWPWIAILDGIPHGASAAQSLQTGRTDTPETKFATYNAVANALRGAAKERPLLVTLEDLHRADLATIELVEHCVKAIQGEPIFIVATYRDGPAASDAASTVNISNAIAALTAQADPVLVLRGLAEPDIIKVVEALRQQTPSPKLTSVLLEKSGGNPRFIHQLLTTEPVERALSDPKQSVATSQIARDEVFESVVRHLDTLSEACRSLLRTAAVLGRDFELAPLAAASGLSNEAALALLDEACAGRVLARPKSGGYRFAHTLVRDTLYARLKESDRVNRHAGAARALCTLYGGAAQAHASELAHHFARAAATGCAGEAVRFAQIAADAARARGEHEQEAHNHGQALAALRFLPSDERRTAVQLSRARALSRSGKLEDAREAFFDTAELARAFGDPIALAEAAVNNGALALPMDDASRALYESAKAMLTTAVGARANELRELVAKALSAK